MLAKISYIIQEFCEFIEKTPFKDEKHTLQQLSIYTTRKDLKNHKFIGLTHLNPFEEITHLNLRLLILNKFKSLNPNEGYDLVTSEKKRLDILKNKLEAIINYHSLDIDEEIISEVSQLCIEIRAFEISYKYNNSIDDLIEQGLTERKGVFGAIEIANLYKLMFELFTKLLQLKIIKVEFEEKNS